jgi:hypothetical protein
MHNNVTFSVNLSDGLTDTFKSSIGVKQGCILISTLFSLFINSFGNDCDALDLNGKLVSCLLYADDIVLLSESAQGLQNLLNKLKIFCDK